jgi:hypothetical protein
MALLNSSKQRSVRAIPENDLTEEKGNDRICGNVAETSTEAPFLMSVWLSSLAVRGDH